MSGWHCRRSSMSNSSGGARTRTFFKLTNRWRSDIYSVRFRDVFRVEECIEVIWQAYKKDSRGCKLSSKTRLHLLRRFGSGGMSFTVRRVSHRYVAHIY